MTGVRLGTAAIGTTSIGGGYPGAPRSDTPANPFGFPDAMAIDLTDPATLQTLTAAPGRFTVTNTSGAPAAAIFDVTVRFHDLARQRGEPGRVTASRYRRRGSILWIDQRKGVVRS